MVTFTTNEYYTDKYLMGRQAVIDTASFPSYALKATQRIKQYTGTNIDETVTFTDEVQMCCCEIAEYIFKQDNTGRDPNIASERVGEYSLTFVSGKDAEDIKQSTIKGIIYNWLATTGLLYRG